MLEAVDNSFVLLGHISGRKLPVHLPSEQTISLAILLSEQRRVKDVEKPELRTILALGNSDLQWETTKL